MARKQLPERRTAITEPVVWNETGGPDHKLLATFGVDQGHIREVFIASFRAETGLVALVNDACILLSRCLQHGDSLEDLVDSFHENRKEGDKFGPPASMLGAVARKALQVQRWMDGADEEEVRLRLVTIQESD